MLIWLFVFNSFSLKLNENTNRETNLNDENIISLLKFCLTKRIEVHKLNTNKFIILFMQQNELLKMNKNSLHITKYKPYLSTLDSLLLCDNLLKLDRYNIRIGNGVTIYDFYSNLSYNGSEYYYSEDSITLLLFKELNYQKINFSLYKKWFQIIQALYTSCSDFYAIVSLD